MKSNKAVVKMMRPKVEYPIAPRVREILEQLGEDPLREGLERTPERVEKALQFLTSGYSVDIRKLVNGAARTMHSVRWCAAKSRAAAAPNEWPIVQSLVRDKTPEILDYEENANLPCYLAPLSNDGSSNDPMTCIPLVCLRLIWFKRRSICEILLDSGMCVGTARHLPGR